MTSIAHVETAMKEILNERAEVLAKDSGAIQRVRKFGGADLLHTLVFGWMQHPCQFVLLPRAHVGRFLRLFLSRRSS